MAAVPGTLEHYWPLCLIPTAYIAGVTLLSRGEVTGGRHTSALVSLVLVGASIAALFFVVDRRPIGTSGRLSRSRLCLRGGSFRPSPRPDRNPTAATIRGGRQARGALAGIVRCCPGDGLRRHRLWAGAPGRGARRRLAGPRVLRDVIGRGRQVESQLALRVSSSRTELKGRSSSIHDEPPIADFTGSRPPGSSNGRRRPAVPCHLSLPRALHARGVRGGQPTAAEGSDRAVRIGTRRTSW